MDLLNGRGKKCKKNAVLPVDVITEILTRQPVKSLLRFRCVSKPFCALIDSPYFIKKHLNHSIESQTNHKLIMIDCDSINLVDLNLLDQALEIKHTPHAKKSYETEIIGSVNGLVCLFTADNHIVVWNLATKKYHIVSWAFPRSIAYAFGYDSVYNDYKIVRINQFLDHDLGYIRFKVDVYSLRSNSWQTITQDFPYHIRPYNAEGFSVLVCGALHWCVKESQACNSSFLILAIDLATNCFSLVAHPDTLDNEFSMTDRKLLDINIGEVGGHLCVVCNYWKNDDVWLMKNYQVKESWIKVCSLSRPKLFCSIYYPFAYSKKRDKIMLLNEDKKLLWYDLKTKMMEKIKVRDCPYGQHLNMAICVESLVPPTPEGGIM